MPGHGLTAAWAGHHRFVETATSVADFIRSAGIALSELDVLGHSWGGVVAAHLPQVGVRPARLVLLDPPWLSLEQLEALTRDPTERRYDSLGDARLAVRAGNPDWSDGDIIAKARPDRSRCRACPRCPSSEWSLGRRDVRASAPRHQRRPPVADSWRTVGRRARPRRGVANRPCRVDPEQVITITRGGHSPHRTHPEATVLAVLRALA